MKSRITEEFRVAFARLPKNIQRQARKAYRKFEDSPDYPGLHFRKIHTRREFTLFASAKVIVHWVLSRMMKSSGFGLVRMLSTIKY